MKESNWREQDVRLFAILVSLLISGISLLFPDTPNDDAYTYIRTADIFLQQGLAAAYQHYSWATYSVVIGLTSKLGLELFSAAALINALFYALLIFAFLSIVREISDSRLVLLIAAIVILVYPQLNEYRSYLIRDIGFWALALVALWQFLVYARSGLVPHAIGFCLALLVASSFRVEAMAYLIATPFALLFDRRFDRLQCRHRFLLLECIVVGVILLALIVLAIAGANVVTLFVDFISVYQPFLISTFNPGPDQATAIGEVLFGDHAAAYSQEYIAIFMASGLFAILLANLFNGIGGPYFWLLVYGSFSRQITMPRQVALPVIVYLIVNGLVLLGFLIVTRYLSSRYAILFCLMLVLFVPQIVVGILQRVSEKRRQMVTAFISIFFIYCAIDSYYSFGQSKSYVFDAVDWIAENSDESNALLTNNFAIAYFSGKVEEYDKTLRYLSDTQIRQLNPDDLISIELNYEMQQLVTSPSIASRLQRVVAFADETEERIVIYRRVVP